MHAEDRKPNDEIAENEQTKPGVPWFAARDAGQSNTYTTTLERSTDALRRALDRLERTL